jgi:Skp family chaperone for outer membrane proteins
MEGNNNVMEEKEIVEMVEVEKNVPKTKNGHGMIFSGILLVAVVVLYVLFFTKKEKTPPSVVAASGGSSGLVLTVNNDSINAHFVLVEILKSDLETETEKYRAELQKKSAVFEERYRNYMINVQNNSLTQTQMQNAEKQLMKEKNDLEELSAKYTEIMTRKEISVQRELMDSLINATKRVNEASFKADYVFATSEGSAIICSNPAYDITKEVIEELNHAYNKTHKK